MILLFSIWFSSLDMLKNKLVFKSLIISELFLLINSLSFVLLFFFSASMFCWIFNFNFTFERENSFMVIASSSGFVVRSNDSFSFLDNREMMNLCGSVCVHYMHLYLESRYTIKQACLTYVLTMKN